MADAERAQKILYHSHNYIDTEFKYFGIFTVGKRGFSLDTVLSSLNESLGALLNRANATLLKVAYS